jgi:hypothetical protein
MSWASKVWKDTSHRQLLRLTFDVSALVSRTSAVSRAVRTTGYPGGGSTSSIKDATRTRGALRDRLLACFETARDGRLYIDKESQDKSAHETATDRRSRPPIKPVALLRSPVRLLARRMAGCIETVSGPDHGPSERVAVSRKSRHHQS